MPSQLIPARSLVNLHDALVVLLAVQDPEDGQEQVDDIEIQADGGRDFLLHMVVSHDQLGVHQDIPAEDQRTDDSIP